MKVVNQGLSELRGDSARVRAKVVERAPRREHVRVRSRGRVAMREQHRRPPAEYEADGFFEARVEGFERSSGEGCIEESVCHRVH